MHRHHIFINRRQRRERRKEQDPCRHMALDLYHRKRRKTAERRAPDRTLEQDYYAAASGDKRFSPH